MCDMRNYLMIRFAFALSPVGFITLNPEIDKIFFGKIVLAGGEL